MINFHTGLQRLQSVDIYILKAMRVVMKQNVSWQFNISESKIRYKISFMANILARYAIISVC